MKLLPLSCVLLLPLLPGAANAADRNADRDVDKGYTAHAEKQSAEIRRNFTLVWRSLPAIEYPPVPEPPMPAPGNGPPTWIGNCDAVYQICYEN
jgi:hypothetical protein